MAWSPLRKNELSTMIAEAVSLMEPEELRLWNLVRIPPVKWYQHPWGDLGGGFWVVGIVGINVIWYNDIECGFNVSQYDTPGVINSYGCNQDELQHTIHWLATQIKTGDPGFFQSPDPMRCDAN